MEITLRNKIQNRIVNAPLDHIVPNGQVAEQESEQGKEQIKPSILIIPKGQAKDNPNERPPQVIPHGEFIFTRDQRTKEKPKIRKPSDPALPIRQVGEESIPPISPKRTQGKGKFTRKHKPRIRTREKNSHKKDSLSSDISDNCKLFEDEK